MRVGLERGKEILEIGRRIRRAVLMAKLVDDRPEGLINVVLGELFAPPFILHKPFIEFFVCDRRLVYEDEASTLSPKIVSRPYSSLTDLARIASLAMNWICAVIWRLVLGVIVADFLACVICECMCPRPVLAIGITGHVACHPDHRQTLLACQNVGRAFVVAVTATI